MDAKEVVLKIPVAAETFENVHFPGDVIDEFLVTFVGFTLYKLGSAVNATKIAFLNRFQDQNARHLILAF